MAGLTSLPDTSELLLMTAILFAAQHGHNDIVRMLLSGGADVNARGSQVTFLS